MRLEHTRLSLAQLRIPRTLRRRLLALEAENRSLRSQKVVLARAAAGYRQERELLKTRILQVARREQERIGQELHTTLCSFLGGIKFKAALLEQKLGEFRANEAREAALLEEMLNEAIQQARQIARGLHPVGLEKRGLRAALRALLAGVARVFHVTCTSRFPQRFKVRNLPVAVHLYGIAEEAVQNACRHGHASRIAICLSQRRQELMLAVRDNGLGFEKVPPKHPGMGVALMQYRAAAMGATLTIRAVRRGGTVVTCRVPKIDRKPASFAEP